MCDGLKYAWDESNYRFRLKSPSSMKLRLHPIQLTLMIVALCGPILMPYPVRAQDSVVVPASTKYINCAPLRLLFVGKNYRQEWSTPVKMPVFHLKKEQGGFTIKELGGGQQTKSLRLLDKNGEEWVLRTADKDVAGALAATLKNKMASNLVKDVIQDMISAAHPYGSLTVPDLARAAGVVVAQPRLFYVPDDPAFGEYRELFANTVCFLEDREPTPDQSETESTDDVMKNIFTQHDHRLIQEAVLRARLLDMLIADWDRHEDQWKWGVRKRQGVNYYYPVPKDRDFAYFKSNGLIVLFASMTVLPHMHSFSEDGSEIKKLSNKTWEMDAQWLNQLNEKDWKDAITLFQQRLTDSVIHAAVTRMPGEIYEMSGKDLEQKLKNRRDGLLEHAMKYYRFLALNAYIVGTDEEEIFSVSREGDQLAVTVTANDSGKEILYRRVFDPSDTYKIVLKGLKGNDRFSVEDDVSSSIRISLQGGEGDDIYSVKGKIKATIEDHEDTKSIASKK